ncbi:MAG TPA: DNA polymerase III subunit delta' [Candidatus Binatia bacterium]|nr:DNA polymerase III subunit delta' [Candidatus Binatia bacterium]
MQNHAWKSLIGHRWAADVLYGAVRNDRVGHAYLFTGPEHVGKATLARLFAQTLNCLEPDPAYRPCGECRACRLIAADRHPDVRLVEPELSGRGKRTLKIDEIRDLQHDLNLASYEARRKIAILAHFDAATTGAANAFLKTLEEPPGNVVLLLTASEPDTLLPTITSRCRVLALRPLPASEVAAALRERWQVAAPEAARLAHLADGRPGWAIGALREPMILEERKAHLALLSEALPGDRVRRFELADRLAKDAEGLPDLLKAWLSWWRDATLLAWGSQQVQGLVNVDQEATLRSLAAQWHPQLIAEALAHTRDALWQLEHNANARLVMENLLMRYPSAREVGVAD